MGMYSLCIFMGVYFAPRCVTWNKTTALALTICGSALIAIPVSLIIDERSAPATGFLAMATLLLFPLLFVANVHKIFYALIPGWFLQASVMAWQWFFENDRLSIPWRTGGIAENENAGAAFLLLGAIFLVSDKRLKWLAVPLLMVIPFSGGRWVLVVAVAIFGLMFLSRKVQWKWILVGIGITFLALIGLQHSQFAEAYRVNADVKKDVQYRANPEDADFSFWAIWIPRGFHDTNLHSLPIRMADETGLLSTLAWAAVGAIALWRQPRYSWQWWCLAAVCLLSVMYYFTWIGPLGMFWWLLVNPSKNKDSLP